MRFIEQNNTEPQQKRELTEWFNTITSQNYFTHNENIQIQKDGLAMGAPSSGLISEIFLQHMEQTHMTHVADKHKIIEYFRYVDDILLIYDSNHTDIQEILTDFNTIHPNLKFTAETESDNRINYLDITIHRTPTDWKISIYRKPTFTDTIIPYTSNHPTQHKFAAIRFLYNRLNTYDLPTEEYKQEEQIIHNILSKNSFPAHPQKAPNLRQKKQTEPNPIEKQKWATFTYIGKETTFITNIFRRTNIKIAFRTKNTIGNKLLHKQQTNDKYTLSGIYKLTCPACNKAYVGQTGINFTIRFNEHKYAFRTNSHTSKIAQHLIDQNHPFGTIHNTMQIIRHHKRTAPQHTRKIPHIRRVCHQQPHKRQPDYTYFRTDSLTPS
jgi:hypothetical protein